jgi:hypothetical protein
MMILVHKVEGQWQQIGSAPMVLRRAVATCVVSYADGRVEHEVPCAPYPVEETIDPRKVRRMVEDSVWGEAELQTYGLKIAVPFEPPEGKIATGAARFVEDGDTVLEQYDLADEPPAEPPPTAEQRVDRMLADYGLSRADLLAVLLPADSAKG